MPDQASLQGQVLQPLASPRAESDFRLWRDAPGWRNLLLAAIGFSVAFVSLPLMQARSGRTADNQSSCAAGASASSPALSGSGRVVGFLTAQQAARAMQSTQFMKRMAINPDYINNTRILVHLDGSLDGSRFLYVVPKGMTVWPGDLVEVAAGHLDPSLPCHYIPNLVVRDLSQ
jgi:hypothetical protein